MHCACCCKQPPGGELRCAQQILALSVLLQLQAQQEAAVAAATGATEGRVMTRSMRAAERLKKVGGCVRGKCAEGATMV